MHHWKFKVIASESHMKTYASASEQKISPSQSRIKSAVEIIALMSLLERRKKKSTNGIVF